MKKLSDFKLILLASAVIISPDMSYASEIINPVDMSDTATELEKFITFPIRLTDDLIVDRIGKSKTYEIKTPRITLKGETFHLCVVYKRYGKKNTDTVLIGPDTYWPEILGQFESYRRYDDLVVAPFKVAPIKVINQ